MRLIIAGSRGITDYELVKDKVDKITQDVEVTLVLSGRARGVDRLGEKWARMHDIDVMQCPAQWDTYGRSAGYKRNVMMAQNADALIAFWDGESKGTKHMIDTAREYGLKVRIVRVGKEEQ